MQRATARLEASNIELARVDAGFVCEVCQRFYTPTEGYRWVENGNTQRAKRLCGYDVCGAKGLNMALTVDENGQRAWECPGCGTTETFLAGQSPSAR